MSAAKKGKRHRPEDVERRVAKLRGKKRDPAIGRKISAVMMGHGFTAEARLKISLTKRSSLKNPLSSKPWEREGIHKSTWWKWQKKQEYRVAALYIPLSLPA